MMSSKVEKKQFTKVLIANRGEITCRIARSLRAMGIFSVAVYSEPDGPKALHVQNCDQAIALGGVTASENYLDMEKIVQAAIKVGAQAIHPGYGFLSENSAFAKHCGDAGLEFIGPSPYAIEKMGNKGVAKHMLKGEEGIPLIPGYSGQNQETENLAKEAEKIGFPVLIKAAAGGGGKGMRVVRKREELLDAIDSARTEAKNSFKDDFLLIEKYFDQVRHIEIQIFGDKHGNVIHLGERECSVQRRHQKVLEESPSVVMTPELRQRMGASAVKIGQLIQYVGAGTVEFIVDEHLNHYFLEVNTRLQVEHPVTESVTGIDLVQLQVKVAQGYSLEECGVRQEQIQFQGHAVECRLYAEDPENNFFPCTGIIKKWQQAPIQGVRYDTGIKSGSEISIYYDPMIAKIIVHAPSRIQAIQRLISALQQTQCLGLKTNKHFLMQALAHPKFQSGDFNTHFIQDHLTSTEPPLVKSEAVMIAATLFDWNCRNEKRTALKNISSGWRNVPDMFQTQHWVFDQDPKKEAKTIEYRAIPVNRYKVNPQDLDKKIFVIRTQGQTLEAVILEASAEDLVVAVDSVAQRFSFAWDVPHLNFNNYNNPHGALANRLWVHSDFLGDFSLQKVPRLLIEEQEERSSLLGNTAPMPGKIFKIVAPSGTVVKLNQVVLIMESMKMEVKITAKREGEIEILVKEGELVQPGKVLFQFKTLKE